MAAVTAAVVGVAGAVGGAAISGKASRKAAKGQQEAADAATQLQREQYLQAREDLTPTRIIGNNALRQMAYQLGVADDTQGDVAGGANGYNTGGGEDGGNVYNFPGGEQAGGDGRYNAFQTSPGYQFALDEGLKGASRAAAAGGYRGSGRAIKESIRYSQGVANQEYGNYYNRLSNLATGGAGAIQQGNALGANFAAGAGNNLISSADARASGLIAGANATNAAINSAGQSIVTYANSRGT